MSSEQPGYSERDSEPTTEQTGGDPEVLEEEEEREREGQRAERSGGDAETGARGAQSSDRERGDR